MIVNTGARTDTGHMCERLAGHVDRCIFSFVEMCEKLQRDFPELIPPSARDKEQLASGLGRIMNDRGIWLQTCGTYEDWSRYGIHPSGCMALALLGAANGVEFRTLKHRGMRKECNCFESRDIGAYDTCPAGCRYCYANRDPRKEVENWRRHDPESPLLLGSLRKTDTVTRPTQRSLLKHDLQMQLEL